MPVLASLTSQARRCLGGHDLNIEPVGIVVAQIQVYLRDQVRIMGAILIQPEDRWCARGPNTTNGQLDPITDRCLLRLARSPDIACFDGMFEQRLAGFIDDSDGARLRNLERLVV